MFTFAILVMLLFVSYRLPAQVFGLVTPSQSGIWFRNDIKESDSANILVDFYMFNGGGVATGDIDEDGLLDIVFTSTQKGLAFYKNEGSWKFTDRTRESGLILPDTSQNTGVLIADLNTDCLMCTSPDDTPRTASLSIRDVGNFETKQTSAPLGYMHTRHKRYRLITIVTATWT
jgi:hypothetical protein